jgi:hypothetical protein
MLAHIKANKVTSVRVHMTACIYCKRQKKTCKFKEEVEENKERLLLKDIPLQQDLYRNEPTSTYKCTKLPQGHIQSD